MVAIAEDRWYNPPGQKYTMKVKVAFITVTLPSAQVHCDKVITKECLNQLLTEIKYYDGVKNYIWKAEAQENGNLHYHIAVDCPIDADILQRRWNRIINKLGYVDRYTEKTGKKNPPSTDIHKVKDVENIAAYISAYMAKKELRRPMCGKYWGCSQTISRCDSIKLIEESEIREEVVAIEKMTTTEVKQLDYCQLLFNKPENWMNSATKIMSTLYRGYISLARIDELESKKRKVIEDEDIGMSHEISETVQIQQTAETMINQVEQLSLIDELFESQQKSPVQVRDSDLNDLRDSDRFKVFSSDTARPAFQLYRPRPGGDAGE